MRGAHHCRSPICSWSLYSMKSSGARTRRQSSHVQLIADSMALADSAEARRCAVGGAASRRRYKQGLATTLHGYRHVRPAVLEHTLCFFIVR